ncbi:phage tail protein [Caballeronia sp. LZ035]|uniref:phage tail protein n=1 Tax=Caballeronia sp. LZ035 TaxID=3038568 RepID=UPI0028544EBE|nr:phage tail protein [Caballeronia sp. LZ035]MDR5761447.1 phage tail protein [Caballeronia sp. LZ035]
MSQPALDGYRFATAAQFGACIGTGADISAAGLQPFAPYPGAAVRLSSAGGHAPAVTRAGDLLWRDDTGRLYRLAYADATSSEVTAPVEIAQAARLVAGADILWAAGSAEGSIAAFDIDGLARRFVVDIADSEIVDIAGDARDGVFALLRRDGAVQVAHVDCAGRLVARFDLPGAGDAVQLTYLARGERLVVLTSPSPALMGFVTKAGAAEFAFSMLIAGLRPCFDAWALSSDACARLFIAGTDGAPMGGRHHALTLDAEGELVADLIMDERPAGIAGDRSRLVVADARGLVRFEAGAAGAPASSDTRAELLTPPLRSPSQDRTARWLRIDARVHLPPGAMLEIAWASTDDPERLAQAQSIASNGKLTRARRQRALRDLLGPWKTLSFHGDETPLADESVPLSAPLFDVGDAWLWVDVALSAPAGAGMPSLSELMVLYQGGTLLDELPAVYRRDDADGGGGFLRSLVGLLESTTQSLDARIAHMAANVSPDTAPDAWLDFVARWLGLPWDDAFSPGQKRAILARAETIMAARGTRTGVEALLDGLLSDAAPGSRRRFRIVDYTADYGMARLNGAQCAGSRLPAMLGGLPATATELGMKAVLGCARLPQESDTGSASNPVQRFVGRISIELMASPREQVAWEPWLAALIGDFVPANVRVKLRWRGATSDRSVPVLDDFVLEAPPAPRLGDNAVTGVARLTEGRGSALRGAGAAPDSSLY